MPFTSHYLTCAGREVHFTEWGEHNRRTVIAWHGLARTGRDMDALARELSRSFRVICPDTIGRGLSQWSPQPQREYCMAFYTELAQSLLGQLGVTGAHWVGTSMGGAIGLSVAAADAQRVGPPLLRSLLLNDSAPQLADAAIARIRAYAGQPPAFDTVQELEAYFRTVYKPYGWLSGAQWRHLTETSVRRLPDGRVTPHYDPAMVQQFTHHPNDYAQWSAYDRVNIPVLCLRGAESDLVEAGTTQEMLQRGPGLRGLVRVVQVAGCGHAPALNVPEQWALVCGFLEQAEPASGR